MDIVKNKITRQPYSAMYNEMMTYSGNESKIFNGFRFNEYNGMSEAINSAFVSYIGGINNYPVYARKSKFHRRY